MEEDDKLSIEQLLLLENLTYLVDKGGSRTLVTINSTADESGTLTVERAIDKIDIDKLEENADSEYGSFVTGKDWVNILNAIKEDDTLCQMKIVEVRAQEKVNENDNPECSSVLFVNEQTKEAVVAFRGTAGYEWKDNFLGGAGTDAEDGVSTEYQEDALEWFNSLNLGEAGYDTITVTGHSKGGNKAKYITIMEEAGLIDRCVSFDGQGFSDEFFKEYADKIIQRQWKITNHNVDYDYVNLLLNDVGRITYYKGYDYGNGMIGEAHCPNTFFQFGEDGRAGIHPVEGQAEEMKILNEFLNSYLRQLPEKRKVKAMEVLGGLVEAGFNGKLSEDFDEAFKEGGVLELAKLADYSIKYVVMHPEFTGAISSIVEKFCLQDLEAEIKWYLLKKGIGNMLPPYPLRKLAGGIENAIQGKALLDIQLPSVYWPLEKNRVFDIDKMKQLGNAGKALMDAGSQACSEWESTTAELKNLYDSLEGEVKSSALNASLSMISGNFKKGDYELLGTMLYNTTNTITEELPVMDSNAADVINEVTEKLANGVTEICAAKELIITNSMGSLTGR